MNKNLKDRADILLQSIYLDGYEHGYKEAISRISNYMALDKIRADIEEAKEIMNDIKNDSYYAIKMNDLREIINKYIGESEDKWKKSTHGST